MAIANPAGQNSVPTYALRFSIVFLVFISSLNSALYSQVNAFWISGASDWNIPANWSGGVVPNNGGTTYNVFVDGGAPGVSSVNMNVNSTINQLNVDAGESVHIVDSRSLTLNTNAQVNNNGLITVTSSGNLTRIVVNNPGSPAGFFGTGQVTLAGGGAISGNGRITNGLGHGISGTGNIGLGSISFTNLGTVSAGIGESLMLDPVNLGAGTTSFDNQGVVQAAGGGLVTLTGSGFGEFGGSGEYRAEANSRIELISDVIVRSSRFATIGNGEIRAASGSNNTLNQVVNMGNFVRSDNGATSLVGSLTNSGQIAVNGGGNATRLRLQGNVLLNGGGDIALTGSNAGIDGNGRLTNVNNTISGNGTIGTGSLSVVNQGVIRAGAGNSLLLDPVNLGAGTISFDNQNIVAATGGGTVIMTGSGFGEFGGAGSYSAENGSQIQLETEVIVRNTTFSTSGSGTVQVSSGSNATLDGVANNGMLVREDNGALRIENSLSNAGTIRINGVGNATRLRSQGNVLLNGGGSILIAGSSAGIDGSGTITNVNNTISGNGRIGFNDISIINQGIVQAGAGESLLLDPRNNGAGVISFNNQNVVRAVGGGVITLTGSGFGEFGGAGVYQASDLSRIDLITEVIVRNTTFTTGGTGVIRTVSGSNATLDDVTINGNFERSDNGALNIVSSLTNVGTMTITGSGNATRLRSSGNATIGGGGSIVLAGSSAGIDGSGTLTNVNNTFSGNGSIGSNGISFINQGTVVTGSGQSLTIDPRNNGAGVPSFDNQGLLHAAGGTVIFTGSGFGEFANRNGGRVRIDSTLRLETSAIFSNQAGGRIEGNGVIENLASSFSNTGGVIAPGLSTGILTVQGNFSQGANGELEIEWGGATPGTLHDQLVVTGNVSLAGTLEVDLLAGITDPANPGTVQEFTFITYGGRTGTFQDLIYDGVDLTPLSLGSLTTFYAGNSGSSGLPGLFRRIEYESSEASFSNYLALPGDANGDGFVDGTDFGIWNANKFSSGTNWTTGDFNNDGVTDGSDFGIWNANKFTSVPDAARLSIVPEPANLTLCLVLACTAMRRRKNR
jgi:hypothetical protein